MEFNIRLRNIFYLTTGLLFLVFLYIERGILAPFILAMIFAYIFNPLINFFSHKLKIPRSLSILTVYLMLISSVVFITIFFTRPLIRESESIIANFNGFISSAQKDIKTLPILIQPFVEDYLNLVSKNQVIDKITQSPFPFVSRVFFEFIHFFVFLFSAFFFLKDGRKMIDKLLLLVPNEYRVDMTLLLRKINNVLASYLRGQLILVTSMIIMLFVCFSILGVKYALTISLFSAIFEIVPFIGPIAAGILGTSVIVISGGVTNFDLNLLQVAIIVVFIYLITRQLQDYLIAPFVMGRATELHPMVILFSVLAGEHVYGILGVLIAVPIAGSIKIIYEFMLDKIHEKDEEERKRLEVQNQVEQV